MDIKAMMEQFAGAGKGGKSSGASNLEMNEFGMSNMMEMMKQVEKDPELKRQMEGYWKMLDNMSSSNPEEYKKFID
jgi:hypothetical protein